MEFDECQSPRVGHVNATVPDVSGAIGATASYSANSVSVPAAPLGLEALVCACQKVYPDQLNPLQVTAVIKYWLGGPDPLDYISMFANPGNPVLGVPPHWHYVSFGLSDLHGDSRVHDVTPPSMPSGFGFELTFRLKRETTDVSPPTWPATLMQALAKYVFQSDNRLCAGDHVPWHSALDCSDSRLQHMLMADDPQLTQTMTPFGTVSFVQIIGVCHEELEAAQHWNGPGVLEILKRLPSAGGEWLVTDMRRGESMYEVDPALREEVEAGIEVEGSNLSGVNARCLWVEADPGHVDSADCTGGQMTDAERHQIKEILKKGLLKSQTKTNTPSREDKWGGYRRKDSSDSSSSGETVESAELLKIQKLRGVHLTFNLESGRLLPLALRGRLSHGRHFTFKSVLGDQAITFVSPAVKGSLCDVTRPYMAKGVWLQVRLEQEAIDKMLCDLSVLSCPEKMALPQTFAWSEQSLSITVVADPC